MSEERINEAIKGFYFYRSWYEDAQKLPISARLEWYEAIMDYAITGNKRKVDGSLALAFGMACTVIDAAFRKNLKQREYSKRAAESRQEKAAARKAKEADENSDSDILAAQKRAQERVANAPK